MFKLFIIFLLNNNNIIYAPKLEPYKNIFALGYSLFIFFSIFLKIFIQFFIVTFSELSPCPAQSKLITGISVLENPSATLIILSLFWLLSNP